MTITPKLPPDGYHHGGNGAVGGPGGPGTSFASAAQQRPTAATAVRRRPMVRLPGP